MRVALITPEYPGCGPSFGVGTYVARLARMLARGGDAVCIAVVAEHGCWLGHADEVHQVSGLAIPAVARPWWARRWLTRTLGDLAPDVVELPNWGGLGAFLPHQWPTMVRLSTSVAQQRPRSRLRRHLWSTHLRWERATVRRADLVVANSVAGADATAPLYGRRAEAVVPHAWEGPTTEPASDARDVLFVGRLEPRKGVDVLLGSWPAVHRRHPQAVLHVVGADPGGLTSRMASSSLHGIRFHGRLDDAALAAVRRRCVLQVIPSRSESFGLVVLEAWAAGLAVVASDCPGLAETVRDAGLLVPNGEAAGLADGLAALLADPARCRGLVAAGRQRLAGDHGLDAWRTRTRDAYQRTAGAWRSRRGLPGNGRP